MSNRTRLNTPGPSSHGDISKERPLEPKSVDAGMIIEAVSQEIHPLYRRVYELEQKLSRYESAFERMFQEELDRRTKPHLNHGSNAMTAEVGALQQLRWRLEKEQAAKRES